MCFGTVVGPAFPGGARFGWGTWPDLEKGAAPGKVRPYTAQ